MKTAIIYARYSPRPNQDSMSIDFQFTKCREYCRLHGFDVLAEYYDKGISGKSIENRPGLNEAIERVCLLKDLKVLVIYSLSRLARNTKDAIILSERLDKAGANLAIVTQQIDTSTAMGRAFFKIMAVIGELQREITSENTASAMRQKLLNRSAINACPPYGLMLDPNNPKHLLENPAEKAVIRKIIAYEKQGLTLRRIAIRLNEENVKARGTKWRHLLIGRLIDRYKTDSLYFDL